MNGEIVKAATDVFFSHELLICTPWLSCDVSGECAGVNV